MVVGSFSSWIGIGIGIEVALLINNRQIVLRYTRLDRVPYCSRNKRSKYRSIEYTGVSAVLMQPCLILVQLKTLANERTRLATKPRPSSQPLQCTTQRHSFLSSIIPYFLTLLSPQSLTSDRKNGSFFIPNDPTWRQWFVPTPLCTAAWR